MKKLLFILLMAILAVNISAQDREPSPFTFTFKNNGDTIFNQPLNIGLFKQEMFIISSQWGAHPRMLQALKFNSNSSWSPNMDYDTTGDNRLKRNTDPSYKLYHIWDDRKYDDVIGFNYEPTLELPEDYNNELIIREGDTTHPVFGFKYRKGTILPTSDSSDENFNRLLLYHGSNYVNSIVLKNTWLNNRFFYLTMSADSINKNGMMWVLSINLRRLDSTQNAAPNDTILTIKLPYTLRDTLLGNIPITYYDSIMFYQIPYDTLYPSYIEYYNYMEDRGIGINTDDDIQDNTKEIVILNKMLPSCGGNNCDITIKAEFITNANDSIHSNINPSLRTGPTVYPYPFIDTMDIEVKYHGHIDIGIDNIRITTPHGFKVYTGYYDEEWRDEKYRNKPIK